MRRMKALGEKKQSRRNRVLPVLAAIATLAAIGTGHFASAETEDLSAVKPAMLRPSSQITYDENGKAYYMENGQKVTGRFSIQPNYTLGDVDGSGSVDSRDAVKMLVSIAAQGAGTAEVSEEMLTFGDVNGDGLMNARDVSDVLRFAAANGSGQTTAALGTAYFYADENGMLCSGMITDTATGNIYYAGADYRLCTGWVTDDEGRQYYCNAEGAVQSNTWITLSDGYKGWLNADGTVLHNGWLNRTEGTYYLDADGHLSVGEQVINGQTYFFDANGIRGNGTAAESAVKEGAANGITAETPVSLTAEDPAQETTEAAASASVQLSGWQDVNGARYYFNPNNGQLVTNSWLKIDGKEYCLNAAGVMLTGFQTIGSKTYYLGTDGVKQTGLVNADGNYFFFDEDGVRVTGWQTVDGKKYYFQPDIYTMAKGLTAIDGVTYLFGEDGTLQTGNVTYQGTAYTCSENGAVQQTPASTTPAAAAQEEILSEGAFVLNTEAPATEAVPVSTVTETIPVSAAAETVPAISFPMPEVQETPETVESLTNVFDNAANTVAELPGLDDFLNLADFEIPAADETANTAYSGNSGAVVNADVQLDDSSIKSLLNTCPRGETKREITVYNRQKGDGAIDFTLKLSDNDIAIIEQFAAEHFPENSTLAEKLYITHQWIHKNVDYAYAGAKWNAIVNKSYVDAIFNYRSGQCVQYNGAMASVLAYYGYDVYMVRGWTRPGVQHYWTECKVNGRTYLVECGNLGKNGDSWQYFFKDYPNPGAYQ